MTTSNRRTAYEAIAAHPGVGVDGLWELLPEFSKQQIHDMLSALHRTKRIRNTTPKSFRAHYEVVPGKATWHVYPGRPQKVYVPEPMPKCELAKVLGMVVRSHGVRP